ncbi:Cullin repeat-like-containing domain protein [Gongronella butleri]|nr:Cullin repeat-like-containing domain protein [Gongronella butleri]
MNNVLRKKTVGMDALRRKQTSKATISSPTPSSTNSKAATASITSGQSLKASSRSTTSASSNMPMVSGPITIDLHRFADENLQPEEMVKQLLGSASEESIRGFHKSLQDAKQTVSGDLQRNVYRNYTEFVSISKEIVNLDGDIMHLKMNLNEVRGIWDNLHASTEQSDVDTNQELRSEMVVTSRKPSDMMASDMQAVYRAQLTALWETVEGSQKYVKYTPSRHVVREFTNFIDIEPKSGQPRQLVHLFLLNDCLLVAARKKRSAANKYRLIAIGFWKLKEIQITEMKATDDSLAGIQVHAGNRVFAFRADRKEENYSFMQVYKRLQDDQEVLDSEQSQSSHFRDSTRYSTRAPAATNGKESRLTDEEQEWLEQLGDDLEVLIALRRFEDAVVTIDRARKMLARFTGSPPPWIQQCMDQLATSTEALSSTIANDLSNPLLSKLQFQRYVDWLLRLGKGEQAREVFLATRSLIIKKRIRQLVFEGDTSTYVNELALVVFTLIRNTCEWYRDSFKQNEMSSGFMTWVREQTETYAEIYKRQVFYQNQLSCKVIAECFKSMLDHCTMLRKVGVDLKFILEDMLQDNIKETITAYEKKVAHNVDKYSQQDNFTTMVSQNIGSDIKVTSSVVSFYNLLVKYVSDICLLAKLPLYTTVIDSVSRLTEHYLRSMLNESQKRNLSKDQRSAALLNVSFVLDNVIPRVSSQLNHHFDRPIPELDTLRARLRELTFRK